MDALEAKLAALEPRRLNAATKEVMLPHIAPYAGNIAVVRVDGAAQDVGRLQRDLKALFAQAGWNAAVGVSMGATLPDVSGGVLLNLEAGDRTDAENALIQAFHAAGLRFDIGRQIPNAEEKRRVEIILTHDPDRL